MKRPQPPAQTDAFKKPRWFQATEDGSRLSNGNVFPTAVLPLTNRESKTKAYPSFHLGSRKLQDKLVPIPPKEKKGWGGTTLLRGLSEGRIPESGAPEPADAPCKAFLGWKGCRRMPVNCQHLTQDKRQGTLPNPHSPTCPDRR